MGKHYQIYQFLDYYVKTTGIGLNLCRALVNLHGGKITAGNRNDGITGSVFTVSLPLGNKHLKPEEIDTEEEKTEDNKPATFKEPKGACR